MIGALGHFFGWWHWISVAYVLVGAILIYLFLLWLGGPTRYRGRRFEDFAEFLNSWPVTLDNGGRVFIEPETSGIPRLRFHIAGRGLRKRLLVRFPTRKATRSELQRRLEALTAQFEDAVLRGYPSSIELRLSAHAPYTGSVASRGAEAAFRALGCGHESTYTIHGYGDLDPYYDLEITEKAAERTSGWLKRFFERRARAIRSAISRPRTPPGGPAV